MAYNSQFLFHFSSNLATFLLYHISNPSKCPSLSPLLCSFVCSGCPPLFWHCPFFNSCSDVAGRNNFRKDRFTPSHTSRRFQYIVDGKKGRGAQSVAIGACGRGFSILNLCRSCVCCHSLYEFICLSVLLCLEDTVSLESSITSGSSNLSASFSA